MTSKRVKRLRPSMVDDFAYDLPPESIAQHPVEPRDSARLLVCPADGDMVHATVAELGRYLGAGDVLVVNDTRVLAARLNLRKQTGGAVEVFLLEPCPEANTSPPTWYALVRPGRRVPEGTKLVDDDGIVLVTVGRALGDGRRLVTVADDAMERVGQVPLPPYITAELDDPERYQTVFADRPGSVAAPTAGLHLTDRLLGELGDGGVAVETIELQVGLGTFRPITAERIDDHVMHAERYRVEPEAWERIRSADRVVAVGTTVVRTLESIGSGMALSGSTELFIRRGFEWRVVDVLLTNFHVPRSSLLVMIDAFMGPAWRRAYAEALDAGYRFLSFGDAMLIERRAPR